MYHTTNIIMFCIVAIFYCCYKYEREQQIKRQEKRDKIAKEWKERHGIDFNKFAAKNEKLVNYLLSHHYTRR